MKKWVLRGVLAVLGLLLVGALAAWLALRASLPVLDGERTVPGLSAPATVTRDALGVVTIDAASEADAYRALGWVHAQERFFEMDWPGSSDHRPWMSTGNCGCTGCAHG